MGRKKCNGLVLLAAWLLLFPKVLFADGCFIPPTALAKVQIPDQRALIHFADGTETLVIDTSFQGDGTNFAWVIPVPSEPTVQAATTGLFPTLEAQFQPKVIHYVPYYYRWVFGFALFISFIVWNYRRGGSWLTVLACLFLFLILAALLLPALATAGRSISASSGPVRVLNRKVVGVFDTATLSSPEGAAVLEWLNQNGFATPTNMVPTINDYARQGWCFVASKVRMDVPTTETAKAHPLALKFKTEKPVYPLRLTGVENEHCRIELFIFGPERASVPHFTVERCARPEYPALQPDSISRGHGVLEIVHPSLRTLVDGSPVATKLAGDLTRQQMAQDAFIAWEPYAPKQLKFYSEQGASVVASNISFSLLVFCLLIWHLLPAGESRAAIDLRRTCLLTSMVALILWVPIYCVLPKIPVTVSRFPDMQMERLHWNDVPMVLEDEANEVFGKAGRKAKPDLSWVRRQLEAGSPLRQTLSISLQTNLFTGQPWHEEDSPGNYTLRQTTNGIDYLWYDANGGEHAVPLFRESDQTQE